MCIKIYRPFPFGGGKTRRRPREMRRVPRTRERSAPAADNEKGAHTHARVYMRPCVCVRVYSLYNLPFTRPFILLFFPSYFNPSVILFPQFFFFTLSLPVSQNSSYFSNFCVNGFVRSPHSYYTTIIIISRISSRTRD